MGLFLDTLRKEMLCELVAVGDDVRLTVGADSVAVNVIDLVAVAPARP